VVVRKEGKARWENTYRLSVLQSRLVHLEDTEEIGAQVGEDEEIAGGIKNGLVRAGLV
jgi:hypothetical protein